MKAIDFWLQVCEEEVDRNERASADGSNVPHLHLLKRAYPTLLPIIMEHTLTKQSEDVDDDRVEYVRLGANLSICFHYVLLTTLLMRSFHL